MVVRFLHLTHKTRSPSSAPARLPFFSWEGSPTKIDYRKNGTRILASLLEDLVNKLVTVGKGLEDGPDPHGGSLSWWLPAIPLVFLPFSVFCPFNALKIKLLAGDLRAAQLRSGRAHKFGWQGYARANHPVVMRCCVWFFSHRALHRRTAKHCLREARFHCDPHQF